MGTSAPAVPAPAARRGHRHLLGRTYARACPGDEPCDACGCCCDDEKARAAKWGIDDLDRIYTRDELVKGDCIFAATGVTSGSLLEGVKYLRDGRMTTESVVMRASSGTVRWIKGEHRAK